ncbi:MAG: hypothetical protein M0R30_00570 [Methanoregula sp.]|uniref:hypothetical protein n=1 Tax=Methanoregula sp. TaxID=2052170 RepID=UPI0025E2089C|nr:hypothetical protein [Methanoregula sp.]MCK9630112.1 hypothetical protein [Methanoregula sp.]
MDKLPQASLATLDPVSSPGPFLNKGFFPYSGMTSVFMKLLKNGDIHIDRLIDIKESREG